MAQSPILRLSIAILIVLAAVYLYTSLRVSPMLQGSLRRKDKHVGCGWHPGDAIVVQMKTKMGVTYDGGHWFHMAENFMAAFSEIRDQQRQSNASVIYFVFDAEYVSQLNAMTKFMATVAVTDGSVREVHFMYSPEVSPGGHRQLDGLAAGSTLMMKRLKKNKTTATHHVVHLDRAVPATERFVVNEAHRYHEQDGQSHCAKYFGSVGGKWPTPQRGHWFPRDGDVDVFRARTALLCPRSEALVKAHAKPAEKPYRLVIYQRDLSRRILDGELMAARIGEALGSGWDVVTVMHQFDRSPCELSHILLDTDVLVTPHGFQSMVLLFLPRPSLLFEVFPYRYQKAAYAPLCKEFGIFYGAVMSPPVSALWKALLSLVSTEQCMNNRYCRNFARDDDVRFTEHAMVRLQESVAQMLAEKGRAGCSAVTPSELDATASANAAGVPLSGFIPTSRYVVSNDPRDTLVRPVVCQSMY